MTDQTSLKVAFVLPSLAAGGAERVLITLMNHLDHKRFEPHFISLKADGPLRDLIADDVTFHGIGDHRKVTFGLPSLLMRLRKTKPDIIVCTMAHMNFGVLLIKPFLPRGTKIIIREAITPSFIFETVRLGWLARLLYKFLYPAADMVICPAKAIIDEFDELPGMKTDNFELLHNPVNRDRICAEQPTALDRNYVHFICAGRLHTQKGFDRLIKTLPDLKTPNWKLTILGDGEERQNLENLIQESDLSDKITLAGYAASPWAQIAEADCFLMPSRFEGMPNAALEALAVGTPVIATAESGGIAEIASLAPEGAVKVVSSMPEFIQAMEPVKSNPADDFRPTLLPSSFELENVMERFTGLLRKVS